MHHFDTIKRLCLTFVVGLLLTGPLAFGQAYTTLFAESGGYPGGVNTDSYTTTTGWTEIIPPSIGTNQWSPQAAIPFTFNFYGTPVSHIRASGNGLVTFLSNPGSAPPNPTNVLNPNLLDPVLPDSTIAAYWTDFTGVAPTSTNDRVYTKVHGTAPNRQFWIRWFSYEFGPDGDFHYASVVLEETTNKIYIVGEYSNLDDDQPVGMGIKVSGSLVFGPLNPATPGNLASSQTDDDYYEFAFDPALSCIPPVGTSLTAYSTAIDVESTPILSGVGIDVEYGTNNFPQGSGTILNSASSGNLRINNLNPGVLYDIYIRSTCGGGSFSDWAGPYLVRTPCLINTFPFAESFDNSSIWSTTNVDSCWANSFGSAWEAEVGTTPTGSTGPNVDITGTESFMYIESNSVGDGVTSYLTLPAMDLSSLTNPTLQFFYHKYGATMGDLYVEASLDSGQTWTAIDSVIGETHFATTDPWTQKLTSLPSTSSITLRFAGVNGTGSTSDMAIDEVYVGEEPCALPGGDHPGGIYVDPIFSTSEITVRWDNNVGPFRVEWGVKGFTQGTSTINTALVTNDSSYTITGLFKNTEYEIYVYGDCTGSGGSYSFINPPVEGFTLPAPQYYENFETYLPDDRWEEAAGVLDDSVDFISTSSLWLSDDWLNVASSPDNAARIAVSTASSTSSLDDWFLSPYIDMGAGGSYELIFNAAVLSGTGPSTMQTDDTLFIVVNNDTGQVWSRAHAEYKIHEGNQPTSSGNVFRVDLSSYTGLIRIGFHLESSVQNTQAYDLMIDNFRVRNIPACAPPIGISVDFVGQTDASATWTAEAQATQYIVTVVPKDTAFSSPLAVIDTVSIDSAYISGLDPATSYDVYVSSLCGATGTAPNGPVTFTTQCLDIFPAPYFEDFSSLDEGPAINGLFPNCFPSSITTYKWEIDEATGANTHSSGTGPIYDNTSFPNPGGKFIYTEATSGSENDTASFETPLLDLAALTQPGLSFAYHMYGEDYGTLSIDISEDGVNWIPGVWSVSGEQQTDEADPWIIASIDLSAFGYDSLKVRFNGVRGPDYECDISVDDISVDEFVGCGPPLLFEVDNIATTDADFTWLSNNSSVTVAISTTGDPNDSANTQFFPNITSGSLSVNSLMSNSCYTYFIRGNCASDTTDWVGGSEFCTPCPTYATPYVESFDSTSLNSCFQNYNASGNTSIYSFWRLTTSSWPGWGATGQGDNTGNGGYAIGVDGSSPYIDDVYLETPNIDMSGLTNPVLQFALFSYNDDNDDNNELMVSIYENGAWTDSVFIYGENDPNWLLASIDLSSYDLTQPVKFRFEIDKSVSGNFYHDYLIDDIYAGEMTCGPPSDLSATNVTTTSVDLSWTDVSGNGSSWIVEYGGSPYEFGTGTIVPVIGTSTTINGLNSGTDYCFYVREICGTDTTDASMPVCISTPCPIYPAPYSESFDSTTFSGCMENYNVAGNTSTNAFWKLTNSTWPAGGASGKKDNTLNGGYAAGVDASSPYEDDIYLETPEIDMSAVTNPVLEFFLFANNTVNANNNDFMVSIYENGAWSDSVFTYNGNNSAWVPVSLDLSGYNLTQPVRFRFEVDKVSGQTNHDILIDDIYAGEGSACGIPMAIGLDTIDSDRIRLYWTPGSGSATSWLVEYGSNIGLGVSSSVVSSANDTVEIGGLAGATEYCFYVRELCGTNDTGAYSVPICAELPCAGFYSAPYSFDFEGVSTVNDAAGPIEGCWKFNQTTADPVWTTQVSDGTNLNSTATGPVFDNTRGGALAGGKYVFLETSASSAGDTAGLESPKIYVGNLTSRPQLNFFYHMYGDDMGTLRIEVRDVNGPWVAIDSIVGQQHTVDTDPWLERNVVIDGFSDTIYVKFVGIAGSDFNSDMAVDDISIGEAPSCPNPLGLDFSNITDNSVDLNWTTFNPTATYLADYGQPNHAPGTGTVVPLSGNPATLSGLSQGTCFDVYVREVCSPGDSTEWIGPINFCTSFTCGPLAGPVMPDDTILCTEQTMQFTGSPTDMYWEDANGFVIQTGTTLNTDTINSDTTFYARAYDPQYSIRFGPKTDIATAGFGNFSNGEMITVINEVRIDTVTLKSNGARSGLIRVWQPLPAFNNNYDDADIDTLIVLLQEVPFSVPSDGEWRVPVGMALNPGSYFVNISFGAGTGELFRATGGAQYPYVLDNIMSIDSAVGVSNFPETRVYYLFDWTVTPLCVSPRDSVFVDFGPEADASFTENSSAGSATATEFPVDFDATASVNGVSYDWDFGDGTTGSGDIVSHDYLQNGSYTVELVVTGVCGDTDTTTTTINIQGINLEENGFNGLVKAFPNPTTGVVTLEIETQYSSNAQISLSTLSGQIISEEELGHNSEWSHQMDLSELPRGVYLLRIRTAYGVHVERITKQ